MLFALPYLLLTACDSREQKALNAQREAQASANAQAYIKQKYGFTAAVTNAEVDRRHGWISTQPLSDVLVQMQYENRDFTVYITGEGESVSGADNYQAEEIRQAVFDTVNAEIPGLRQLDLYAVRKAERLSGTETQLFEIRYDGSNLSAVLSGAVAAMRCYYPDTDFSDGTDFAALEKLLGMESGIRTTFYACRDDYIFSLTEPQLREWCASHAVYCTEQRTLAYILNGRTVEAEYNAFDLRQYGDFYYSAASDSKENGNAVLQFQEVTPGDPARFDGYGTRNAQIASKAYQITADAPAKVKIYYPCSAIEQFDYDSSTHSHTRFAVCSITDGTERFHADMVSVAGEYVCAEISLRKDAASTFEFLYQPG